MRYTYVLLLFILNHFKYIGCSEMWWCKFNHPSAYLLTYTLKIITTDFTHSCCDYSWVFWLLIDTRFKPCLSDISRIIIVAQLHKWQHYYGYFLRFHKSFQQTYYGLDCLWKQKFIWCDLTTIWVYRNGICIWNFFN